MTIPGAVTACLCKADALIFGQAFIGYVEAVIDLVPCVKEICYVAPLKEIRYTGSSLS